MLPLKIGFLEAPLPIKESQQTSLNNEEALQEYQNYFSNQLLDIKAETKVETSQSVTQPCKKISGTGLGFTIGRG